MKIIDNRNYKENKKYKYGDYQIKRTDDKERYYLKDFITGKTWWTYDKKERDDVAEKRAVKYEKLFAELNESDRILRKRKLKIFNYDSMIPHDTLVLFCDRISQEEYEKENVLKNNPSAQMQLSLLMEQGNTQSLLEKLGVEDIKTEFDFIVLVHIYNIISNKVKPEFDINEIKYKLSQNEKYSKQGNIHKTELDEEIEKSIIKWYNTIFELHISEEMKPFFNPSLFETLKQYTSKGKPVLPIAEFNTKNKNGTDVKAWVLSEETPSPYFAFLNSQKEHHKQVVTAPNNYLALSSKTLGTDSKLNLTISNKLAELITIMQGHKKRYGGTNKENKQLYKINFNTIYDACKEEIEKDTNKRRKKQVIRNRVYKLLEDVYKKQLGIITNYKEYQTKNKELGVELIGIKPKDVEE